MTNLLTPEEAAGILRICERTLRKLRKQGQISYVTFGVRKILYRLEDIEAFVEASVRQLPAERPRLPTRARDQRPVFDIEELREKRQTVAKGPR